MTFKIKPKAGFIIRDPETMAILNSLGEVKPKTSYWLRHLKDGSVELVGDSEKKATKSKEGG